MAKRITLDQRRFAKEYIKDRNGKQAAIRAGYAPASAEGTAVRLLKQPRVRELINTALAKEEALLEVDAHNVLRGLADLAFYDVRKLFNDDGTPKHITELDDRTARAVSGLECATEWNKDKDGNATPTTVRKFKLADRGQNLERLGRHLKLFPTRVEVTGEDGGAIKMQFNIRHIGGDPINVPALDVTRLDSES